MKLNLLENRGAPNGLNFNKSYCSNYTHPGVKIAVDAFAYMKAL